MGRKIIDWFKEGLDEFKSPYPKEPPMTLEEWIEGGAAALLLGSLFWILWALLIMLVD